MKNTVTVAQVDALMGAAEVEIVTMCDKVTVVAAKLPNGFVIVESAGCVDPANYDVKVGGKICLERIRNKVWELEGYRLQEQLYRERRGRME